jgi:hypothetical protein
LKHPPMRGYFSCSPPIVSRLSQLSHRKRPGNREGTGRGVWDTPSVLSLYQNDFLLPKSWGDRTLETPLIFVRGYSFWVIKDKKTLPKLKPLDRLYLPVVCAMEIRLYSANVGMPHQSLHRSKVIPFIQKGSGESMTHHMETNPFMNQSLFRYRTNKTIQSLWSKASLGIRPMFPQSIK